jgi:hypothetical protein
MKFYELERIKKALGLPPTATASQIVAKIAELREKEEELEALKGEGRPGKRPSSKPASGRPCINPKTGWGAGSAWGLSPQPSSIFPSPA